MTSPVDVLDLFIHQVDEQPDKLAVLDQGSQLRYHELAFLAGRFATAIAAEEDKPRVAILLPQGAYAYAAMLGTLMAGGYYCPINTDLPAHRISLILKQFDPHVVICEPEDSILYTKDTYSHPIAMVSPASLPSSPSTRQAEPHEFIYVIFTSGSTGLPKGVVIRRRSFSKFIEWAVDATGAGPLDRWGQFSNIGFDLSALDIYTALGTGATLVCMNSPMDRLFPALAIKRHNLTVWHSVPSVIDLMSQAKQIVSDNMRTLRLMSFCGEPLKPQHLEMLFSANPEMTVFNTYGPTEGTVFCTWIPLTKDTYRNACSSTVAIGDMIPGWNMRLVDGQHSDEGEIVIYGAFIGAGYWRNSELTDRVFRTIQHNGLTFPAYFTGDWGFKEKGNLFFSHRIDRQVKIHGYRVELDEIDYYVREFGILNCRTIFFDGRIYCFLESSENVDVSALRRFIAKKLPNYSVPSEYVVRSNLPRNQNDKIDVKELIAQIRIEGISK